MRVAADTADETANAIQGVQTEFLGLVDSSRAQWGGTSGPAFAGAVLAWSDGVNELIAALIRLSGGVGSAATNYDATEANVTSSLQAIAGQAPAFGGRLSN